MIDDLTTILDAHEFFLRWSHKHCTYTMNFRLLARVVAGINERSFGDMNSCIR